MNRQELRQHLFDYAYGELPPEMIRQVEEALAQNPECQQELERLQALRSAFGRGLPLQDPPHLVHANILREARKQAERRREEARDTVWSRINTWLTHPTVAVAAAAMIVVVLAIFFVGRDEEPAAPTMALREAPASPLSSPAEAAVAADEAPTGAPAQGDTAEPSFADLPADTPTVALNDDLQQGASEGGAGWGGDLAAGELERRRVPAASKDARVQAPQESPKVVADKAPEEKRADAFAKAPAAGRAGFAEGLAQAPPADNKNRAEATAPPVAKAAEEQEPVNAVADKGDGAAQDKDDNDELGNQRDRGVQAQVEAPKADVRGESDDVDANSLYHQSVSNSQAARTETRATKSNAYGGSGSGSGSWQPSTPSDVYGRRDNLGVDIGKGGGGSVPGKLSTQGVGGGEGAVAGAEGEDAPVWDSGRAEAAYRSALQRQNRGDNRGAVGDFDQVVQNAPRNSTYHMLALFYRGYNQQRLGDHNGAIASFTAVVSQYPNGERANEARFYLAQSLLAKNPNDPQAERLLNELKNGGGGFASQAGETWNRYFGRKPTSNAPRKAAEKKKVQSKAYDFEEAAEPDQATPPTSVE